MQVRLKNARFLFVGVRFKPVRHVFIDVSTGLPSHTPIAINGVEHKANLGAAAAMECAKQGAAIHLFARNAEPLHHVRRWICQTVPEVKVDYSVVDIEGLKALKDAVDSIKDDNPYLPIEEIDFSLIESELSVVKHEFSIFQLLMPRFKKQKETRAVFISSMSAIRSFLGSSAHSASKGALSRMINSIALECYQDRIFIFDVRPGACDAEIYNFPRVQSSIVFARANYGLKEK